MNKSLLSLSILVALTGCAGLTSPTYECDLAESPQARCASMEQAYAAVKRADPKAKATSVFDAAQRPERETTKPFFQGKESEFPESGQQGLPVFAQPKVHRVWVGPYVDADGNLRTGEYTYFNTPGKWNYGSTRTPGAASGMFAPSKPDALGFTPAEGKKATVTAPAAPPSSFAGPAGKAAPEAVTPPYQKLSN